MPSTASDRLCAFGSFTRVTAQTDAPRFSLGATPTAAAPTRHLRRFRFASAAVYLRLCKELLGKFIGAKHLNLTANLPAPMPVAEDTRLRVPSRGSHAAGHCSGTTFAPLPPRLPAAV